MRYLLEEEAWLGGEPAKKAGHDGTVGLFQGTLKFSYSNEAD